MAKRKSKKKAKGYLLPKYQDGGLPKYQNGTEHIKEYSNIEDYTRALTARNDSLQLYNEGLHNQFSEKANRGYSYKTSNNFIPFEDTPLLEGKDRFERNDKRLDSTEPREVVNTRGEHSIRPGHTIVDKNEAFPEEIKPTKFEINPRGISGIGGDQYSAVYKKPEVTPRFVYSPKSDSQFKYTRNWNTSEEGKPKGQVYHNDTWVDYYQNGGLPKYQTEGRVKETFLSKKEVDDIKNFVEDDTNFVQEYPYLLPEAVVEDKLDRTNPTAVRNWSKEHDPIAYAAREATDEAAPYVATGLGMAFAPATGSLLGAGARGLAATGEAAYGALSPYASAAWNTNIPGALGMSSVPGATVGNLINAGFGTHGATNIAPDALELLTNPLSLENLTNVGIDAFEMHPLFKPASSLINLGIGETGELFSKGFSKLTPNNIRNSITSRALSNTINSNLKKPIKIKSTPNVNPRIDLIDKSTVGIKNDFINQGLSEIEYQQFLEDLYLTHKDAYDNPLVRFKGRNKPSSYFGGIGNNRSQRVEGGVVSIIDDNPLSEFDQGMYFKDKFCPPGSECAKSANSVTSKLYTDLTGKEFDATGNAHNAWHMEDQMTRHGGRLLSTGDDLTSFIESGQLKIGDRILMGNEVSQATEVPGYIADPSVRHAGTYAGLVENNGQFYPVIFESGKNNPMFLNPINNTFTGPNSVKKILRAQQFLGNETGTAIADKNIRYAFRDSPPVATYSSDNQTIQKVIDDSEKFFKEYIKKTYDITNDEFYELLKNLVGVGAQETKIKGKLPGSPLSKAKINLQDWLNDLNLTKPIKQTINLSKKLGNKVLNSSKNPDLLPYPGASKIEMEAAKLSAKEKISFKEAVSEVKSRYQQKDRFTLSTVEPSKGPFRQKYPLEKPVVEGLGEDLKTYPEALPQALSLMAKNFKKAQKLYPNATPRQLIDITTLMWNSPGKAANKELVNFYIFGKNNPDPSKFQFDYISKINKFKDEYINVHPQGIREPEYEIFRGSEYPEIEYQYGGNIEKAQNGERVFQIPEYLMQQHKNELKFVESADGVLMKNPESTATGFYGQLFSEIENLPEMKGITRDKFANDTTLQNKIYDIRFKEGIPDSNNIRNSTVKNLNDLYTKYGPQIKDKGYNPLDLAGIVNLLGRRGTREFLGYHVRDKRPLAEVFPSKYGKNKTQANHTPDEYIEKMRSVRPDNFKDYNYDSDSFSFSRYTKPYKEGQSLYLNLKNKFQNGGEVKEDYNIERAKELGYTRDETGHLPSVDHETGMWLKSKEHPTAYKEFISMMLNPDMKAVINPEGYFEENQLQYISRKENGGEVSSEQPVQQELPYQEIVSFPTEREPYVDPKIPMWANKDYYKNIYNTNVRESLAKQYSIWKSIFKSPDGINIEGYKNIYDIQEFFNSGEWRKGFKNVEKYRKPSHPMLGEIDPETLTFMPSERNVNTNEEIADYILQENIPVNFKKVERIPINPDGFAPGSATEFADKVIIPSGNITMKDMQEPILANGEMLMPGDEAQFDTDYVVEEKLPKAQDGLKVEGNWNDPVKEYGGKL